MEFKLRHKGKDKNRSIKTQLSLTIVCFAVICCLCLGTIASFLNFKTSNSILSDSAVETTKQAAEIASQKIANLQNGAIQTGIMKSLADPNVSVEDKKGIIARQEKLYGLSLGQVLDASGKDLFSGKDYSSRAWQTGESYYLCDVSQGT